MTVACIPVFWYNRGKREWIMMKTKRLTIMKMRECDQEAALNLLTNDIVKKTYMLPDFEKREDAIPLFRRIMELSQGDTRYVRGIYLNDYLIGYSNEVEINDKSIELGYLIHPDFHGQGYMTEALIALIPDLFARGFEEVVCGAFEENPASLRVMTKAGMSLLDKVDEIEYRGKIHRCIYYSAKKGNE